MEDNSINNPLVSIIVITFNSEKYVLETLESIKNQVYKNIELIISDDCSNDDTVDLCKSWLVKNESRFFRTKLQTTNTNTGIPANCNRGISLASGDWIKFIAGDDVLTDHCIFDLMKFIYGQSREIYVLFADIIKFSGSIDTNVEICKNPNEWFCSLESKASDQYQMLLRSNRVYAASSIIKKDLLVKTGGFDERFKLLEDWPFWIKITQIGIKIYYTSEPIVFYRCHENNLSVTSNKNYLLHPVLRISQEFKAEVIIPRLPFIERLGLQQELLSVKTCFFLGNNKNNPITYFIYLLFKATNPFFIYRHLLKIFGKTYENIKYLM